jgi:hypothetical protein
MLVETEYWGQLAVAALVTVTSNEPQAVGPTTTEAFEPSSDTEPVNLFAAQPEFEVTVQVAPGHGGPIVKLAVAPGLTVA